MENAINKYRNQWDGHIPDNLGTMMPLAIWRVTWKDENDQYQEFWTDSEEKALQRKTEIDHSGELLTYVNFEGWFAYRFDEHDKRFGFSRRPEKYKQRAWWEPREANWARSGDRQV